jgi:uncharacterized Zn ribbon protein
MNLLKLSLPLMLVLLLSACKVELTSEEEEKDKDGQDIVEYIFYKTDVVETIYPTKLEYDLSIMGGGNSLEIGGDVRNLMITKDDNIIEMVEVDEMELLTISADRTIIDAVDIVVGEIKIAGYENVITVASCDRLLLAGSGNQVLSIKDGECSDVELLVE